MKQFIDLLSHSRNLALLTVVLGLGSAPQLSAEAPEQQPAWWKDGQPPVISTAPQNNKAVATIGQAKWMVKEALRALSNQGHTQLADEIEAALATPPPVFDVNAIPEPANRDAAWYAKQKAPLQLGYLKALAKPFYDKLNELDANWVLGQFTVNNLTTAGTHYWTITNNTAYTEGGHYPWNPATPIADNKKAATIGQLKLVFALRFETLLPPDSDNDGLPDAWEQQIIDFSTADNINTYEDVLGSADFDNDGVSNQREFEIGSDPTDHTSSLNAAVIAHWSFKETSGDVVTSEIAGGSTGSIIGTYARANESPVGRFTQFGDSNSYALINAEQLEIGKDDADFSYHFWIKPPAPSGTGYRNILHKGEVNRQRTFSMWFRPGSNRIHYVVSRNETDYGLSMDSTTSLPVGEWAFITYVKKGDQSILYINGVEDSRRTLPNPIISNNGPLYVGKDPWHGGSQIGFSDLKVFNTALLETEITTLYQRGIDTDVDGLPDYWENLYSLNLNDPNDASLDSDGDGLTNLEEYNLSTFPDTIDTDGDLVMDSMEDSDNDGIVDLYEIRRGSNPNDPYDRPIANFTVDPAIGNNSNTDTIYATIQEAVDVCPSAITETNPFRIITVKPGVYERVTISGDRRITLLAEGADQETIIETNASSNNALFINEPFFAAHGFVIRSERTTGVFASLGTAEGTSRLSNCIIRECRAPSIGGGALFIQRGRMILDHVTSTGNRSETAGRFAFLSGSDTALVLRNCIVFNNLGVASEEIYRSSLSAQVHIENSWIEGGEFGARTDNPDITRIGYLMPGSPARNTGIGRVSGLKDIHGELRDSQPDAGADEFVSTGDGDSLPDFWERLQFGNLNESPSGDNDLDGADGLDNLGEYKANTNPHAKDTDNDQYLDGQEIANAGGSSDPHDPDTDGDLIIDGIEAQAGMNPINPRDVFDDFDGDRFPNAFELLHVGPEAVNDVNLKPNVSSSPSGAPKHYVVAPSGGTHTRLDQAINAIGSNDVDYAIIEVADGSDISGLEELDTDSSDPKLLILSQKGAQSVSLYGSLDGIGAEKPALRIRNDLVLDGFTIELGGSTSESGGLHISGTLSDVRIKNCLIRHCHSGAEGGALHLDAEGAEVDVLNCTIFDNDATSDGNSVYCNKGTLNLLNTVVWSGRGNGAEIIRRDDERAEIHLNSCVIQNDGSTYTSAVNLAFDTPGLDNSGLMSPGVSSALQNKGLVSANVSLIDYHGDLRDLSTGVYDIGVDEFYDENRDGFADSWFNHPESDVDFDGLTNAQEDFYGTSRTSADSNGDGISDLIAIFSYTLVDNDGNGTADFKSTPFGILATGTDPDADTLDFAAEQILGTSPFLADTDGDGVADNLDDWPLDPHRNSQSGTGSNSAPVITITSPTPITAL